MVFALHELLPCESQRRLVQADHSSTGISEVGGNGHIDNVVGGETDLAKLGTEVPPARAGSTPSCSFHHWPTTQLADQFLQGLKPHTLDDWLVHAGVIELFDHLVRLRIHSAHFLFKKPMHLDVNLAADEGEHGMSLWNCHILQKTSAGKLVEVLAGVDSLVHFLEQLCGSTNTTGCRTEALRCCRCCRCLFPC